MPSNPQINTNIKLKDTNSKKFVSIRLILVLFSGLLLLDQLTKVLMGNRDFFFARMHFHLVKNYGLSFGADFGNAINFLVLAGAFFLFLVYLFRNRHQRSSNAQATLILAGAISNLIDRVQFGYVRDFWDIGLGFTFNLADLFIVIGLLAILFDSRETPVTDDTKKP